MRTIVNLKRAGLVRRWHMLPVCVFLARPNGWIKSAYVRRWRPSVRGRLHVYR